MPYRAPLGLLYAQGSGATLSRAPSPGALLHRAFSALGIRLRCVAPSALFVASSPISESGFRQALVQPPMTRISTIVQSAEIRGNPLSLVWVVFAGGGGLLGETVLGPFMRPVGDLDSLVYLVPQLFLFLLFRYFL